MPRANRHYIPGYVWHITHRCHKGEFLLKFPRDRRRWIQWLFEAKKRYGLCILNYMVTSNHVHLLVSDDGDKDTIPKSIQLIAGRTGQSYNQRKIRKGAFWEDRYHATAVECDEHLAQCLVYIDMNMVRAGVVDHPQQWPFCGYCEMQNPPQRYSLTAHQRLIELLQARDFTELQERRREWVDKTVESQSQVRESRWSESIAVGSKRFTEGTKKKLGIKAKGRQVVGMNGTYELREPAAPYSGSFNGKNDPLSVENTYFWDNIL